MPAYVILFRGVGGATQLPVAPLREALSHAGFQRVATYINSGNAVLASDHPATEVAERVAAICATRFGFTKDVHVRDRSEWAALVTGSPFPEADAAPKTVHAAVLAGDPDRDRVEALAALGGDDRIEIRGRVAYLHTPGGFGRSVLAARFDRGIGVPNTARNWTTVRRLMSMLDDAAA